MAGSGKASVNVCIQIVAYLGKRILHDDVRCGQCVCSILTLQAVTEGKLGERRDNTSSWLLYVREDDCSVRHLIASQ